MNTATAFDVVALTRSDHGKGASRRLRRENQVPAILYGGEGEPEPIMLKHNEVIKHLSNDGFYSSILMLSVDGKEPIRTILRDVQRHPFKQQILHMDFQRVVAGAELTVSVPLHFINEESCVGVKAGGIIAHIENEISVSCRPRDLPESIEVDMSAVELGASVQLSDLKLPEGVRSVDLAHGDDHDRAIAAVNQPRKAEEETVDGAEDTGDAGESAGAADAGEKSGED